MEAAHRRLRQCVCVRFYKDEVRGRVECASAFRSFADGRLNELARGIVPTDVEGFVVRTLSCDVYARVRLVAERAFVRRGVAVTPGEFAIV